MFCDEQVHQNKGCWCTSKMGVQFDPLIGLAAYFELLRIKSYLVHTDNRGGCTIHLIAVNQSVALKVICVVSVVQ